MNETPKDAFQTQLAEFDWLMSLALDDQLDAGGHARFDELLGDHPDLAGAWQAWQWIDREFAATPALTPPSGFVARFELRLAEQEQQRQQRLILLSATLALLATALVFASTAGVGAFVFLTQGQWVGEQVRGLALAYTSANLWFTAALDALLALVGTPQAQIAGGVYTLLLVTMVAAWVQLLRRSARLTGAAPMPVDQ